MHIGSSVNVRGNLTALLAVGLLAACGGESFETGDGEQVYETDETLVGGTNTTLRPEIGTMTHQIGSGLSSCTATLIGSRYVLTAGHCVNFSTALNNTSVKFQNSASSYPASAIHTFGAYRPIFYAISDGPRRNDDVALLQLSTTVPASVATPATIAPVPPNAYQPPYGTQTIFGYGCKSRSTGTGGGVKQYVTFTFGNNTQALCPGDSGGPVVYGSPSGLGQIWAVNSNYDSAGIDNFGGATYYAEDILAVIRQWEGSPIEVGVARDGIDYSTSTKPNLSDCMIACQNDGKCRGFTHQGTTCTLKSAIKNWRPSPGATSYAGVQLAQEVFYTRNGSDYATFATPVGDACLGACARASNCKAYSYNLATQTCRLKNAVPSRTVDFASISGVKRLLEANTDRPGTDFSHLASASAAACQNSCSIERRCRSFTFVQGICYMHDNPTEPVTRTGATSGVKRGLEMNTNRYGSDYTHYAMSNNTPEACQADCARDANCQSFTFAPAGRIEPEPHCWLKNGVPAASNFEGLVSGIRGLDFY